MKTMSMEKAVEYSLDKRIAIHTPTQEVFHKLEKYTKGLGLDCLVYNEFPEYESNTRIDVNKDGTAYADIDWYRDNGYEIIELESPNELTITIHSDGHKKVTATCNDITVEAKCNDSDTFNLSKGSHMAIKRLIDKMNEPVKEESKFKIGDIVEVLDSFDNIKESIGLQGIVLGGYSNCPLVKLPISIVGNNVWAYNINNLKLIRKASK